MLSKLELALQLRSYNSGGCPRACHWWNNECPMPAETGDAASESELMELLLEGDVVDLLAEDSKSLD